MTAQLNYTPLKVGPSATQDMFKSLRYLQEGRSNSVTVRVTRKWEELDFFSTNDVTSVDMVIVDEELVREGCLYSIQNLHLADGFFRMNSSISALDGYSGDIVPNKLCFSEFEALKPNLPNLNLTDVNGYLKNITNILFVHRSGGVPCRLRVLTLENIRGSTVQIALWGPAVDQVGNDPIDCYSIPSPVLVAVYSTLVRSYQGKNVIGHFRLLHIFKI
ncbi:hypothetical protein MKX01_026662 [Papaver californicum]|nr:hypothetical protein MKX01_026662 [Papaver californicum]